MNMFKNIFSIASFAFGASLYALHPDTWLWPQKIGPWMGTFIQYCIDFMPMSAIFFFVVGLTLIFMRKSY